MNTKIIIDESRLAFPLVPITVGRLSSAEFEIVGDLGSYLSIRMEFSRVDGSGGSRREPFAVAAVKNLRGDAWSVYASPFCFPDADCGLEYQVVGKDSHGNDRWLGTGRLEVSACGANGSSEEPPIVPRDTYLLNPVTGLYHRLVAEVDEDGVLTVAVDQEGVEK